MQTNKGKTNYEEKVTRPEQERCISLTGMELDALVLDVVKQSCSNGKKLNEPLRREQYNDKSHAHLDPAEWYGHRFAVFLRVG